jgi:uncharacterized membrane protein YecN with MAPEG domain
MTLTLVPVYAAIFALIFVALSFRVANTRRTMRIGLGHGGNIVLERRMRVQGNFAEYVPFALILFAFIEIQGWPRGVIHGLCLVMLAARLFHAWGVAREPEDIRVRASAMVVTFGVIILSAMLLLIGAAR